MKCSVAKWNSLLVAPFLVVIACCIALALGPVSSYAAEAGDASSQTMAAAKGDVLGAQAKKASASKKKSPKQFTVNARVVADGAANIVNSRKVRGSRCLFLPSYADLSKLCIYNATKGSLYVSSKKKGKYVKVNAHKPIDITSFKRDSSGAYRLYVKGARNYAPFTVKVMKSANIRALFIKSKDPKKRGRAYIEHSPKHTAEARGSMTLVEVDGNVAYNGKLEQIKGRGNSTWHAGKKPYQIKLVDKTSLLDGTDGNVAKTWVLLANAFDETFLRNYIAYKTALAVGMDNAPECEFVDLYYDGSYRGNYLLSEKVQVGDGRVEVVEQENESTDKKDIEKHATAKSKNKYGRQFQYVKGVKTSKNTTGGYLIELDNAKYSQERSWFRTSVGTFVLKSPEDASYQQVKYISEYTQAAINELKSGKKPKLIDLESLAQAHLVNEMAKNPDYIRFSSTYFYKDKGKGILHAGPVWDFDLAFGVHSYQNNRSYTTTTGFASAGYANFFMKNKHFKKEFKRVFRKSLLPQAKGIYAKSKTSVVPSMKATKNMIRKSVAMERIFRPANTGAYVTKRFGSFNKAIDYTKRWIAKRLTWMRKAI